MELLTIQIDVNVCCKTQLQLFHVCYYENVTWKIIPFNISHLKLVETFPSELTRKTRVKL